jgi:hypothetical protein
LVRAFFGWQFFAEQIALGIEKAVPPELVALGLHSRQSNGEHLADESIHLAFVVQIHVFDGEALCDRRPSTSINTTLWESDLP